MRSKREMQLVTVMISETRIMQATGLKRMGCGFGYRDGDVARRISPLQPSPSRLERMISAHSHCLTMHTSSAPCPARSAAWGMFGQWRGVDLAAYSLL